MMQMPKMGIMPFCIGCTIRTLAVYAGCGINDESRVHFHARVHDHGHGLPKGEHPDSE